MNEPLWMGEDFSRILQGDVSGFLPSAIIGISIDSRTLQPGEAFFAISGENFDGHDFASAAVAAGASLLVVARAQLDKVSALTVALVIVPDVLEALENLARAARARTGAKIIAVTGSVGKTTTKEALHHSLASIGKVHASPASFNNHWGVPLTLARLPLACDFAIFEIGMNHAGEISPLVEMVRPHIALITRIASAHSIYFSSIEEIALAKAEIFAGLEQDGIALINRDDAQFFLLHQAAQEAGVQHIATFGEDRHADYRLLELRQSTTSSYCHFSLRGQPVAVTIGAPGHHMALNMLAVLGVGDILQLDRARIIPALADFTAPSGRGSRHRLRLPDGGDCVLIDDSYNANPASMRAALQLLAITPPSGQGRRIAVLGDMLELGSDSRQAHEALADQLKQAEVDMIFLLGSDMRFLFTLLDNAGADVKWCTSWQDICPLVASCLREGDVISIKSSKATGAAHIVNALLKQFSNRNCDQ